MLLHINLEEKLVEVMLTDCTVYLLGVTHVQTISVAFFASVPGSKKNTISFAGYTVTYDNILSNTGESLTTEQFFALL